MDYSVNFWRCNVTKQIRIGRWLANGVFETAKTVRVKGQEFTGYEANAAYRLVESLNRKPHRSA